MRTTSFQNSHRSAYKNAVGMLEADKQYVVNNERAAATTGRKNIRLAQSYLWSQVPLDASLSQYIFNVKDGVYNTGTTGILPMERRIKDQDVFFTYALGFYLVCISAKGNASFQWELMTYPSEKMWGGFFSAGIQQLIGLWTAGTLGVSVNGDTLTPAWDMGQHLVIPETQATVGTSSPIDRWFDQKYMEEDGMVITEPNWIINGGNNNLYQLNYASNYNGISGAIGVDNTFHLVMKWQGFLAQNASSIMNNQPKLTQRA
jgi:hypothetical protein